MSIDMSQPVRVAAVQMDGRVADIGYNLEQARRLSERAFSSGARIVALPEFFTTPVCFDERLNDCALEPGNEAVNLLTELAGRYGGYIGGSMLLRKGADVFNTYVFAQPDGKLFTHDKDIPTMWESAFYTGGHDDGVFKSDIGALGCAVCWELIRTQTVKRLRGRINFAITGSNWWRAAANWPPALLRRLIDVSNDKLAATSTVNFAKLLGVPVIHAGQAGSFDGRFLLFPGSTLSVPYSSSFVGETKIVDSDGTVVAALNRSDGANTVSADLLLQPRPPGRTLDETSFWIPKLSAAHLFFWQQQNYCGGRYYRRQRCQRRTGGYTAK